MGRIWPALPAILILLLGGLTPAHAERRVALVIGNSAYQHTGLLANPKNDATDVSAALKRHGFEVLEGFDLDKPAMDRIIRGFADQMRAAPVAVFFYAGHGLQVGGQNYLVPVDAQLVTASALDFEMVRLDLVHRAMEREAGTNILFVDACRNNPLARNLARTMGTRSTQIGRGLAPVEAGVGTLVSFSTQPDNVALDGAGRNSPFAGALVRQMQSSNDDLSAILIAVRNDVIAETQRKQVPWEHSALTGRFYFSQSPAATDTRETALWDMIKDSNNSALFEAYLKRYASGQFAAQAHERLKTLQVAAVTPAPARPDDNDLVGARELIRETQQRLYELNYDPGPDDGALNRDTEQAIREFQGRLGEGATGRLTEGLLRRLRAVGGLKPWGALAFSEATQAWGMSWSQETRVAAVAAAQKSCGANPAQCSKVLTFFGTACAAFAHSPGRWSLVARDSTARARLAALEECQKQGARCSVVATVCADGQDKIVSAP
jgi:Caspase domain/Domain of unknown function (DUF4189)/Putative peptidoglycan binding domain